MGIYYADFETTVYEGQRTTEVWCGAIVEENSENPILFRSMSQFFGLIDTLPFMSKIYFHNLKFDGSFILSYLERNGYKQAIDVTTDGDNIIYKWEEGNFPSKKNTYTTFISRKGIWYDIRVHTKHTVVLFKDSLKVLPFSVEQIGKAFETKHRKTNIEYTGYRTPTTQMSEKEKEYVRNDVLVVKEAMKKFRARGFKRDTIGGCALTDFKHRYGAVQYNIDFPNIYNEKISKEEYGEESLGQYILNSYCGAFVYVNPEKEKKKIKNGLTLDVTSLYPSVMHSMYGVQYPYGEGKLHKGRGKKRKNKYFFQRLRCEFRLKEGKLPFIKIRWDYHYNPRECLRTSDLTVLGQTIRNPVELTLTQTELELFFEHYEVYNLEYLDYCEFSARSGIFDGYIDYWIEQKNNATNKAERTIAKLLLNSLYGKFASSYLSSFKVPYLSDDGIIRYRDQMEEDGTPGYIPIGSAIISEARCFSVKACQLNYHPGGKGFCYCDTDSMHLDCKLEEVVGVKIAKNELCTYKHESSWDYAFFDHAKRYIEHVTEEDGEKVKEPYHAITCAGLPDFGKLLLRYTMGDKLKDDELELIERKKSKEVEEFISKKRSITCFTKGLKVPGKLMKKTIEGGVILYEDFFTIRS